MQKPPPQRAARNANNVTIPGRGFRVSFLFAPARKSGHAGRDMQVLGEGLPALAKKQSRESFASPVKGILSFRKVSFYGEGSRFAEERRQ